MKNTPRRWPFALFFLSGFAGLVYQIIWLRLAFAAFGVVTPVISLVLSVFMLGLGLGSWLAGAILRRWPWSRATSLRAYAAAELLIGIGGLAVPALFQWGQATLLPAGEIDSARYLLLSGMAVLLALGPFCLGMGLTFPFMMQALRSERASDSSFSYLYLANVLGALCGTLLTPLVLVELLGFRGALAIGVVANWTAAFISLRHSFRPAEPAPAAPTPHRSTPNPAAGLRPAWFAPLVLLTTGLASMGMEVVWVRAFTPVLKTQVYSFAGLLFVYLLATWIGSALYRRHLSRQRAWTNSTLLSLLSAAAVGQLLQADPRLALSPEWMQAGWLLLGIVPYCSLLGYLTPKLIDEYSQGRPGPAGQAYAINTLGCIVGPLLASYVLLPLFGVQASGILLALPLWTLAGAAGRLRSQNAAETSPRGRARVAWGLAAAGGVLAATVGTSYEDQYASRNALVLRDHTATVIALLENDDKLLLVNGKPITSITPSTKLMAHMPLAMLPHDPESALVICFGMGTTFRSLLSWNIDTTAVELVPSVRDAFDSFHDDAADVRSRANGRIVIDDGRRFLSRTTKRFDVITLDPPPPPEAAGSSLLYSREFYQAVKPRLTDGGILQQWYPGGDFATFRALLRSVTDEFPHVRVYRAFDGWGFHIYASEKPLPVRTAEQLAARMPDSARQDLLEWSANETAEHLLQLVLDQPVDALKLVESHPEIVITDDRPYNEYYLMRRLWELWTGQYSVVL